MQVDPDNIRFYDGFIYIISCPDMNKNRWTIDHKIKIAEYDVSGGWSLSDIQKMYPYVKIVIFEDALEGNVYKYGNHGEYWEEVGKTEGYA